MYLISNSQALECVKIFFDNALVFFFKLKNRKEEKKERGIFEIKLEK